MTLRLRLVLLSILLGGAALAVADVVVYRALEHALVEQRDDQIESMAVAMARFTIGPDPSAPDPGPGPSLAGTDPADEAGPFSGREPPSRLLPDGSIAVALTDGEARRAIDLADPSVTPEAAVVDALLREADDRTGSFGFDVDGTSYRGFVLAIDDTTASIMAVPSDDIAATLDDLVHIELAATVLALAVLAAVAWWAVGLGLRPLDQIAATTEAIAAGDLSQRAPVARGNTEVARLGRSFNTMLASIETAFDERQRSEDRLRRFVGDASHELRTPLTSVRGYADLIRRGAVASPDDVLRSAERIEQQADRMAELVDELLLLAQLDEPTPVPQSRVDLSRVVLDAVEDLRSVDPERPVQVNIQPDLAVAGDASRLHRVVANLLENIRRHTPPMTAATVALSASDDRVRLTVADDGPGLTATDAARVFDRFYRVDPSRTRATGGTGLGLSIVAAIVEEHGGRIWLETAPGEGCRFIVEFQQAKPPSEASSVIAPSVRSGEGSLGEDRASRGVRTR